jgi:hypothetical protein
MLEKVKAFNYSRDEPMNVSYRFNANNQDVDGSFEILIEDFENYNRPVHTFAPIGSAECPALSRSYVAARSIGGICGCFYPEELREKRITESSGLLVLGIEAQWLTLYVEAYTKYDYNGVITAFDKHPLTVSTRYALEKVNPKNESLLPLRLMIRQDLEESLNTAAAIIGKAMKARQVMPPAYFWCSWYYSYQNFDQAQLEENLEGMRKTGLINELQYVQIDAGYFSSPGDWLIFNERYPKGLKGAFDTIKSFGLRPGIWVAPFMVGNRSELYKKHPDWLLRQSDGSFLCPWQWYNEPKPWGYQDEEYYVLDTSHPEAMEYLGSVFRTLHIADKREDIVMVHRSKDLEKGIVFIFNKTDAPITAIYPLGELGFSRTMTAYDYRKRETMGLLTDTLVLTTMPHGCNLIFLNVDPGVKPDYTRLWNNIKETGH